MKIKLLPPLNPLLKYLLRRYKKNLLHMTYSNEVSRIVDCIVFIFEAKQEARRG